MKEDGGRSEAEVPAADVLGSRWEEDAYASGFGCIAGLDEVGRGPLAGPVVAAAVVLPRGLSHPGIKDSKLLTPKRREALAFWIKEKVLDWGLGMVEAGEIDRINIFQASLLAMGRALRRLKLVPDCLLIDGSHKIPLGYLKEEGTGRLDGWVAGRPRLFPQQRTIKKGDRLCLSIAAASIVAKVARDQMMLEYDRLYPQYGFGQHKGYGSPSHLAVLRRLGPTPIHRRSFAPVRACLGRD